MVSIKISEYETYSNTIQIKNFKCYWQKGKARASHGTNKSTTRGFWYCTTMITSDNKYKVQILEKKQQHRNISHAVITKKDEFFVDSPSDQEVLDKMRERAVEMTKKMNGEETVKAE
ncbi:hypothetical protein KCU98_g2794, partial [Aureobasidium melanogenum]